MITTTARAHTSRVGMIHADWNGAICGGAECRVLAYLRVHSCYFAAGGVRV